MKDKNKKSKVLPKDIFEISRGNLEVLKVIPEMMLDDWYREQLRKLANDFIDSNRKIEVKPTMKIMFHPGIKEDLKKIHH
jgi:hypothetical protein